MPLDNAMSQEEKNSQINKNNNGLEISPARASLYVRMSPGVVVVCCSMLGLSDLSLEGRINFSWKIHLNRFDYSG